MIGPPFAGHGRPPDQGKDEENKTGYFQPELVQDEYKPARGSAAGIQNGTIGPTTPDLLTRNPGHNA